MKLSWSMLPSLVLVLVLCVALVPVHAMPRVPRTPSQPPIPFAEQPALLAFDSEPSSIVRDLPPLKAVLIVGPIDGDSGSWTDLEKRNMDRAAAELEVNDVQVYKFYTPNNDWEQIKAAADGAHFLLYRGHGVYWSPMPAPDVGGFALKQKFVSSEDIRDDLHLAQNAIVMLYGCFTAGSSGSDSGSIRSVEAQRRVAQYADPFLEIGAAGYYADWYGDAFQMFARYLFQGMTLGQAYEAFYDFSSATVERHMHPEHQRASLWLDKDNWGYLKYNNAFVGLADQTLVDLFSPKVMTLTPETFLHLAEPSYSARSFPFQVTGAGLEPFTWTATVSSADASWLAVQPQRGRSGQTASIVITPTGKAPGTYEARIRVVAEAAEIQDREQDIIVRLLVAEEIHDRYLPIMMTEGR
jgi:hypothetical protein